ncbi:MAG: efflux transporter outer membrane subunit [Bacteroidales bacterium]|nr:efflux transporter outer membrane subunit [Bacteroidales bacterium]
MIRNIFYSLLIILMITSCKVGPNYVRPEHKSPDKFRLSEATPDSVLNLKWWELFNNDELNGLIKRALVNNQNVLIAASRIEEARANLGYNKADQYPQIDYDGEAGRGLSNVPGSGVQSPFNNFSGSAQLAWELDFWGKYRRATEAAHAELMATEYAHRVVQLGIISETTRLYFLLLDYHARLEISILTLESRRESRRIIGERFDKGIVPELDLNQAQIQEAIAEAAVPFYRRLVTQTENILSLVLGENPKVITLKGTLGDQLHIPEIPDGIPSVILERRPDVLQAEQLLTAQTSRIGVAQAMRFPSISLTGMLGAASSDLTTLTTGDAAIWSLGGGIFGPIFNFGKNKRRVEIERERMRQDSLYYTQTVLNAFREVEDALIEVSTLEAETEARQKQMKAAQNAAMLSTDRYNGGVTSYLEVLDSERSQFNAELSASETYQLYLNAYIKLYNALGGGWISEEEAQKAQIRK